MIHTIATIPPQSPTDESSMTNMSLQDTRRRKPSLLRGSKIMVSDISDDSSSEIGDLMERRSLHDKPQHRLYVQWAEKQTNRKRVRFSSVQIRRYQMVLGDNPYCSIGPPVSLGWEYDTLPDMDVLKYDRMRQSQRRTNINHLALSSNQRNDLLDRLGVSEEERRLVEKEVNRVQRHRAMDSVWKEITGPFEAVVDSARKMRRVFKRQNARLDDDESCSTTSSQSGADTNRPKRNKRFTFRRQNAFGSNL